MWRPENNFAESILSFSFHMDLGIKFRRTGFCIKCLYPLNLLAGPFYGILSYSEFKGDFFNWGSIISFYLKKQFIFMYNNTVCTANSAVTD